MSSMSSSPLLSLPPELRAQIWTFAFANQHTTPRRPSPLFDVQSAPRLLFAKDCEPCNDILYPSSISSISSISVPSSTSQPTIPIREHEEIFQPLLTDKQIYTESIEIFYSTLTLHVSNPVVLSQIKSRAPKVLRERITKLTLYVHLTDDTRYEWLNQFSHLYVTTFPKLKELVVHNHMRPPTSYDRLIDAVYLVGPLSGFTVLSDVERRLEAEGEHKEDENNENHNHAEEEIGQSSTPSTPPSIPSASPPVSPTTTIPHTHPSIPLTLHFAYTRSEIMFESPFLGLIRTCDAIDEHEAVIRDVFRDQAFKDAALTGDLNVMAVRLLAVARSHEQSWLEGLQRRRMGEGFPTGDGGGAAAAAGNEDEQGVEPGNEDEDYYVDEEDEEDEDDEEDGERRIGDLEF